MLSPFKPFMALLMCIFLFVACGPETIVLRSGIDTPHHHIENGYKLLNRGKIIGAHREFKRAQELDQNNVQAYVGLGLVSAHEGNFEQGFLFFTTAMELAETTADRSILNDGLKRFDLLKTESQK